MVLLWMNGSSVWFGILNSFEFYILDLTRSVAQQNRTDSCGHHQFPFNQHTKAEVMAFTGCASEQTSADVGDVNQQFQLQPMEGANAGQNHRTCSVLQRLPFMWHLTCAGQLWRKTRETYSEKGLFLDETAIPNAFYTMT